MAAPKRYPAPRWQTPMPPDVRGSWGPDVTAYAQRELGITLDRWAARAINRALAYGPDGRLVHRLYLISTARQNGKTATVRAVIGWALTARQSPPWSLIVGLAHERKQANIPYRAVLADLAPIARRLGPDSRGGLSLTRYLGIRSAMYGRAREYHTASREARDALRGESVDLGIFDEVRTQRDLDTWAALEPTTTARPDPLVLAISTAGDERSVLLRGWFDRGLRIIAGAEDPAGFGMTWYAPDDSAQPTDPRAWIAANPSIADGRLEPARIAEAYANLAPGLFRAERLNLWTDALDDWLPPGVWARQAAEQAEPNGARPVLAIEAAPTWRRATVAVAWLTDDGAWSGIADELDASRTVAATITPADLAAMLDRANASWRPSTVCYVGASAAGPHIAAWLEANRRVHGVELGPRELRAASELLRSELVGGRLAHAPDALLDRQARAARPSGPIEAGGWYLSTRESTGEIDAIRAIAYASWAAIAPPEPTKRPNIHV